MGKHISVFFLHVLIITMSLMLAHPSKVLAREVVRFQLSPTVNLDEAGHSLRRAVLAYEEALNEPLPSTWTRVALQQSSVINFGNGMVLLLQGDGTTPMRLLFADDEGPHSAPLEIGTTQQLGKLEAIVVSASQQTRTAQLLVRAKATDTPLLSETTEGAESSPTIIEGQVETNEIILESPSSQTALFAKEWLRLYNRGESAEEAARQARFESPPTKLILTSSPSNDYGIYNSPTSQLQNYMNELPQSAMITLHLVRADSATLQELNSALSYDSSGRAPDNPRVGVESDGSGGTVTVGSPGDRFRGRLRALEASRKAQVESENFLRVPMNGRSRMTISGPSGTLSAWIAARPSGYERAEIRLSQSQGDWGFLGSVDTTVRMRDGQTVTLAKSSYQRTTSQRSNVPIVGDLPWIGPIFGQERSTSQASTYALYMTMELQ